MRQVRQAGCITRLAAVRVVGRQHGLAGGRQGLSQPSPFAVLFTLAMHEGVHGGGFRAGASGNQCPEFEAR